jgi:hypothetical protein
MVTELNLESSNDNAAPPLRDSGNNDGSLAIGQDRYSNNDREVIALIF